MAENSTRSTRLEARVSPDALAMVKRAAEIQGRSVSDFVVAAAHEAAQKAIAESQIIRLSIEDQRAFAQSIANPPEPAPALRRARPAPPACPRPTVSVAFGIAPLSAHPDRLAFSCGVDALDRYIQTQASQDMRRHIANCFVASPAETSIIAGY